MASIETQSQGLSLSITEKQAKESTAARVLAVDDGWDPGGGAEV